MRYIEIIILVNLTIHICFIIVANFILKQKKNIIMISISCILDIIYIFMYIYIPYELDSYKYILVFIISFIPFITKGIIKALMSSLIYLMLNFTLGGSAEILYNTLNNFYSVIISLILILFIFSIIAVYKKTHISVNNLVYEIVVTDDNHSIYLNGYCDTGNFLSTDENIPIVFINNKIDIGKYKKSILIQTVSIKKYINLYEIKEFKIKINNKYIKRDVYIAFADINYMAMFGINVLGG